MIVYWKGKHIQQNHNTMQCLTEYKKRKCCKKSGKFDQIDENKPNFD